MKKDKIHIVGFEKSKKAHNKVFVQDITTPFYETLKVLKDEEKVKAYIQEDLFLEWSPKVVVIGAESNQEAVNYVVKRLCNSSHLQLAD